MTREQEIQNAALLVKAGGLQNDPFFYVSKQLMRRKLKKPPLIEFLPNKIFVIDHDLSEHKF